MEYDGRRSSHSHRDHHHHHRGKEYRKSAYRHRSHDRYKEEAESYYRHKRHREETEYDDDKHRRYHRHERRVEANHENRPTQVVELPWEIICNILAKLPVKSLARFRSVSKSLNELTKDHHFMELHLRQQQHTLILPSRCGRSNFLNSIYIMEKQKEKWKATRIPFTDYLQHITGLEIVATCNGLLCLSNMDSIHGVERLLILVYNPITKDRITMPKLSVTHHGLEFPGNIYLGFDSKRNQYKVIMLCKRVAYIVYLGESYWRKFNINAAADGVDLSKSPHVRELVFFNMEFYKILDQTVNSDSYPVLEIVVMDICEEKFRVVEFVDTFVKTQTVDLLEYQLFNCGKHLALLVTSRDIHGHRLPLWRIWHLVEGIWVQKTMLYVQCSAPCIELVGAVGDDSILMLVYDEDESDSEMPEMPRPRLCNLRTGELSSHILSGHILQDLKVFSYLPSFISLKV